MGGRRVWDELEYLPPPSPETIRRILTDIDLLPEEPMRNKRYVHSISSEILENPSRSSAVSPPQPKAGITSSLFRKLFLAVVGVKVPHIEDDDDRILPAQPNGRQTLHEFQGDTEGEFQPEAQSNLNVDATNHSGGNTEGRDNPYHGDKFFDSSHSSPPLLSSDPSRKRMRLQERLKQSFSLRVPSNTLTRAFASGKPASRTPEGEATTRNKDEEHDDISNNTLGTQETSYFQPSSRRHWQVRLRFPKYRRSHEGMEQCELPKIVDISCSRRKAMYYTANEVNIKDAKEAEKKKKAEAEKKRVAEAEKKRVAEAKRATEEKRREEKKRAKQNAKKISAGSSPPAQSKDANVVVLSSNPISGSATSARGGTVSSDGCWTCFLSFIRVPV